MEVIFSIETISIFILILFSMVALFIANPYLKLIFSSISDYFFRISIRRKVKKVIGKK